MHLSDTIDLSTVSLVKEEAYIYGWFAVYLVLDGLR